MSRISVISSITFNAKSTCRLSGDLSRRIWTMLGRKSEFYVRFYVNDDKLGFRVRDGKKLFKEGIRLKESYDCYVYLFSCRELVDRLDLDRKTVEFDYNKKMDMFVGYYV
jgi:hypothetical protein